MFRFFFRVLATVFLAVAVIMAVLDATRSVAASQVVLTPLGASWFAFSPETMNLFQSLIRDRLSEFLWDPVMTFVLGLPGFAVFTALALIFYAVGRRPERRIGRFAAEI